MKDSKEEQTYLNSAPGPYLSGFTFACWLIVAVLGLLFMEGTP